VPVAKLWLNNQNNEELKEIEHTQLGTFKSAGGWERRKEMNPPIKGGYWLYFYFDKGIKYDFIRAR
jgi:hypothetical protein